MGNHALDLNPPTADYHLSTNGSDWLWAAFSIIALSLLGMTVLDFMVSILSKPLGMGDAYRNLQRPRGTRLFHQLAIIVLSTMSISYFSMASDLGSTPIPVEFRGEGTRQIYVRRNIPPFCELVLIRIFYSTCGTFSGSSPSHCSSLSCSSPLVSHCPTS